MELTRFPLAVKKPEGERIDKSERNVSSSHSILKPESLNLMATDTSINYNKSKNKKGLR